MPWEVAYEPGIRLPVGESFQITVAKEGYKNLSKSVVLEGGRVTEIEMHLEVEGALTPKMVSIPSGEFQMGSHKAEWGRAADEGAVHNIVVEAFQIAENEVTFAEYDRFVQATGYHSPSDNRWGRGRRPVINVSWEDAQAYIAWLNMQTHGGYRLPTEAEWEYSYRAGTSTPFFSGECIHSSQANFNASVKYSDCETELGIYSSQTVPVNELNSANPWGLKHMAGNVWEWCQDTYTLYPKLAVVNLRGTGNRVLRGGSWANDPKSLRAAYRFSRSPNTRSKYIGFRLASDNLAEAKH